MHVIKRRHYRHAGPRNSQHSPQQLSIFLKKCWIFVLITGFKQKLSQCKKAHEGWSIVPFILGGVSFTSRPIYCRGKSPRYTWNWRLRGFHSRSASLEMRRNSCRLVGCPVGGLGAPAPLRSLYIHFTLKNVQVKYYARRSRQVLLLLLLLLLSFTITITTSRSLSHDRSIRSSK